MRAFEFLIEGKPGKAAMSYQRSNRYPDGESIPDSLPPRYQPASFPGVPSNQKCSNCLYYDTDTKKCSKFKGDPVVRPAYWCAKWEPYKEEINEGGWDTTATQGTVIHPSTVKAALATMQKFVKDFNNFLDTKGVANIKLGHPTGSSAYHDVDPEEKIYGDIDLQIVVPETEETQGKTTAQAQGYWYALEDEFVKTKNPPYVHEESKPGHPIVSVGKDAWVQIDLMPHTEKLATWGRFRTTPERGVKGLLNGNMFSVLGELLTMSIQHSGVQFKVRDKVKQPYSTTRKNYELVTVTTDIENFVMDIFKHEAELQNIRDPKIDPMLQAHPGSNIKDVKISNLVYAVKGLANSFALNNMYRQGDLADYSSAEDFINKFKDIYRAKAEKDIMAKKRDKAETPEAQARAEADRQQISKGLEMVMSIF